ncbi:ParB N-terminal domain-containing protein [Kaistia sp. MMO-174]|uniref:ParB N-terminal domain-containing protein n=1 Tax=Kaistia sp. MMO-174 TaxID=3081256 RepID=UPI003019A6A4
MADFRKIDPSIVDRPEHVNPGPAPQLRWLEIEELAVDETYQRRISAAGKRAIRAIAGDFDWSQFSPVLVAPMEGGGYAIIDGQHRTTAAAICGFASVPCQIVLADRRQQAASFAAVNGKVQRITSMQVFFAALAAAEPWALAVERVTSSAKVTVLRYPVSARHAERNPHSTMAVKAIAGIIDRFSEDLAKATLGLFTSTSLGDEPGRIGGLWISALASALAERPAWVADSDRLRSFADGLDADRAVVASRAWRLQGTSAAEALAVELRRLLDESMPARIAGPAT